MLQLAIAVGAVLALLHPARAAAAHASDIPTIKGYTISSWNSGEGVTLGPVRALAQDLDGYLWLGTDSGLFRFDGFHFVSADALPGVALPKVPVRALYVARDGDVWIGLDEGGGIFRLHHGHIDAGGQEAVIAGGVNAFAEDGSGTLWAGHDNGLLQRRAGRWMSVGAAQGMTASSVYHLRLSGHTLLAGTSSGLFTSLDGQRFGKVPSAGDEVVRGSAEDAAGTLWLTDRLRGFRPMQDDDGRPHALAGRGSQLLRDSRGNLWLATVGQGLWRIHNGKDSHIERLTFQDGLATDGIWSLLEDREGNLWIGTHEGLNRLTRHTMTPLGDLGITSTVVRGTGNVVWAASTDGLIEFTGDGAGEPHRRVYPFRGIRSLHVDQHGVVWVAAGRLYRFADGRFTPLPVPEGLPLNRVSAVTADEHTVWFADATQGLWRWDGTRLTPYQVPEALRPNRITALHADRHGSVWVAFEGARLGAIARDGAFTSYGEAEGMVHTNVLGIYESERTGLWVTGSHGLSHFVNGRFVTLGRDNGLPLKRVTGMSEARDGALWLSIGPLGLARLSFEEFERATSVPNYRARLQLFDTSDGMAGMPTSLDSKTTAAAADGRLWFVTGRGLTLVDPQVAAVRPPASGPARVEAAVADDKRFEPGSGSTLPAGTSRLRIDYTALNLTAPERTRFRYRLDGFDDEWRDAGVRRQAFYTNLPPRTYRFQVQAQGTDGAWSTTSADWSFAIPPRFYQTRIFFVLSVLAAIVLVAIAWQVRLRHMRRQFALVLAERARLSREVHDGLLQSMVGVALQIDNVAKTSDAADAAERERLVFIRRQIEDCIVEARQSIWNMRSGVADQGDLIANLEAAGARSTKNTAVRFRLTVTGTPRRCSPRVDTELLRIAQEALTNAVRHAAPAHVAMELRYDATAVTLRVVDDGSGFEQSARASTSHFGLVGMRERAEQLGGEFRLTTATGAGTEVEAVVPLSSHA